MLAAVYRGRDDLRVEEIPIPEPGPGEMLVRVEACGICGTDIKKIEKGLLTPPRVFGHETAGLVARLGRGVARFKEGDRVALHHHIPCGACFYCARKAYAQCARYKQNGTTAGFEPAGGGMAEFVKALDWIVERGAIRVPEAVRSEEAALIEPVNTCLKAVKHAGVEKGQSVLVVGQGPIGLMLMQLARWAGAEVIASDTLADRLAVSRRLGASAVVDARGSDVVKEVRALTEGRGADVVLVAATGEPAFRQAVLAARNGGRILVFAATSAGETASVDLGLLCSSEKEILTSYSASIDLQDLAAQLVFGGEIRVADLITHRLPLRDAGRAVELASKPAPGVLKVVLAMGAA